MTDKDQAEAQKPARGHRGESSGHLRISLRSVRQLFNSLDPSPFHDRDLDVNADHYLVGWAQETRHDAPLKLTLHLEEIPPEGTDRSREWIAESIHNYFAERERLAYLEFRRLMGRGRTSLGIGVTFLVACLGTGELVATALQGVFPDLLREGLTIAGWVAMWRPLQIYLYDWWPVRRRARLFHRMSCMPVELQGP